MSGYFLPKTLLDLFAPRDPLPYLEPFQKLPHEKESRNYTGIAEFVQHFEDPKNTPPPTRIETKQEKVERKKKEKSEQTAYKLEQDLALWDPSKNENSTTDPSKTLFVARISYDTSESKLKREFEDFGSIRKISMVKDTNSGRPRGYAFIEFKHTSDMIAAYKKADGKKIGGRRILVDIELGRTDSDWRPRRLGGGLGNTRKGDAEVNTSEKDDFDGRDRLLREYRNRSSRRRSRSRDRKRSRSRERKRSSLRDFKKEPGESSRHKRSRKSRSRSRSRDTKKIRRRSRSHSKQVKTQVKKETGDGNYGGYHGSGDGAFQPPSTFIKQEQDGYHQNQPQESNPFGMGVPLPPFPNNPYQQNDDDDRKNQDY